ncbi:phage baseplate plug family protein [Bradyrhizobium sp.]
MQVIPLKAVPNQSVQVQLAGQACSLNIYQFTYGLFMDVYVGNSLIVAGVICENLNRIVRSLYLGFIGDLAFLDTQAGNGEGADPIFTGLGGQFQLLYLATQDLPTGEG